MPLNGYAVALQYALPPRLGPDGLSVREQSHLFLPCRESCEAGTRRVLVGEEQFLAVENRRILGLAAVSVAQLKSQQIGNERLRKCRVPDALEIRIHQVRHLRTMTRQLHERHALDGSGKLPAAALVDAE